MSLSVTCIAPLLNSHFNKATGILSDTTVSNSTDRPTAVSVHTTATLAQRSTSIPSMPRAMSQLAKKGHEISTVSGSQPTSSTSDAKAAAALLPTPVSTTKLASGGSWDAPSPSPHAHVPIPAPSTSNPLGIRPSAYPIPGKQPPKGPRSLFGNAPIFLPATLPASTAGLVSSQIPTPVTTPVPKKPVVVGAKWSATRGATSTGSSVSTANTTANASLLSLKGSGSGPSQAPPPLSPSATSSARGPTALTLALTPVTSEPKADLSQMLRYASPSPPPPPPPASEPPPTPISPPKTKPQETQPPALQSLPVSASNKWKRISSIDGTIPIPPPAILTSLCPTASSTSPTTDGFAAGSHEVVSSSNTKKRPHNVLEDEDDKLSHLIKVKKGAEKQTQAVNNAKATIKAKTASMAASSSVSSLSSTTTNGAATGSKKPENATASTSATPKSLSPSSVIFLPESVSDAHISVLPQYHPSHTHCLRNLLWLLWRLRIDLL